MPRNANKNSSKKTSNKTTKSTMVNTQTTGTSVPRENVAPNGTVNTNGQTHGQNPTSQVIPFRQPGWDKHSPHLANQQAVQATQSIPKAATRFNHSRGK